jgi:hypothetical protein
MAFQLQSIDRELASTKHASIILVTHPLPVSGFPFGGGFPLPLQFPPRVTDDTKAAIWNETEVASYEPLAIWMGSNPRRVSIELTYIVTGSDKFTAKYISLITKQLKAYFYRSIKDLENIPLARMHIYDHFGGSDGPADFRLLDIGISHGDTIIKDGTGAFPLLTKIKINAALVTKIGGASVGSPKQNVPGLRDKPPTDWY